MDMSTNEKPTDDIIMDYFWRGFPYNIIVTLLQRLHGINMSHRTLRRKLFQMGLYRRGHPSPQNEVHDTILMELSGPGRLAGYRTMHQVIRRRHHLNVTREVVRRLLLQTDPVSVHNRRTHRLQRRTYTSRGPNDTWHIDGYDKLSPYGFCISGCIDGYSRRIMWLECSSSNHSSSLIAGYYLKCVSLVHGYPAKVRTDCGTENVVIAAIQSMVHRDPRAHIYGTSPTNQRIESWWSVFRRQHSQWWIDLFEDLVSYGAFSPGHARQTDCLRFCFMHVLQQNLDEVRCQWNEHRIRRISGARCPSGIPDQLYFMPDPPAFDCLMPNNFNLPAEILNSVAQKQTCKDHDIEDYMQYLCYANNWDCPTSVDSALSLYFKLFPLIL